MEQGREPKSRDLNPGHTGGKRELLPLLHPCFPQGMGDFKAEILFCLLCCLSIFAKSIPIYLNIITHFCTRCGKFARDNVYHAKIQDIQNVSSYWEKFESLATPSPCSRYSRFGFSLQDNNCGQRPKNQIIL